VKWVGLYSSAFSADFKLKMFEETFNVGCVVWCEFGLKNFKEEQRRLSGKSEGSSTNNNF
jgi:hypothetical protein